MYDSDRRGLSKRRICNGSENAFALEDKYKLSLIPIDILGISIAFCNIKLSIRDNKRGEQIAVKQLSSTSFSSESNIAIIEENIAYVNDELIERHVTDKLTLTETKRKMSISEIILYEILLYRISNEYRI